MGLLNKKKEDWIRKKETDIIWWLKNKDKVGEHIFSFDKKTKFNLFSRKRQVFYHF